MKAIAVVPKTKNSASLVDIAKPDFKEDEVLVKVNLVGLDGTDMEIDEGIYGEAPAGEGLLVIGHESLGEVAETGRNIKSLKIGDRVVAMVRRPDDCLNCLAGEPDMCLKGNYTERGIKGRHGYLSEYYVEEQKYLIKVPRELGEMAVLLEPVSVAEKAIRMAFSVQKRMVWEPKLAMVTGTGSLGLITAMLLRLRDLDVISVDRSDDECKAKIFSQLGVTHFNTKKIDLRDIPEKMGRQIDVIIEETGSSNVSSETPLVIGMNGVIVLTSITGGEKMLERPVDIVNLRLVLQNNTIVGSVNAHRQDFELGVNDLMAVNERWPGVLEKLITARYPPEDIREALASMNENIKVLIDFSIKE
jgi:glucose 1-dehydrogenase